MSKGGGRAQQLARPKASPPRVRIDHELLDAFVEVELIRARGDADEERVGASLRVIERAFYALVDRVVRVDLDDELDVAPAQRAQLVVGEQLLVVHKKCRPRVLDAIERNSEGGRAKRSPPAERRGASALKASMALSASRSIATRMRFRRHNPTTWRGRASDGQIRGRISCTPRSRTAAVPWNSSEMSIADAVLMRDRCCTIVVPMIGGERFVAMTTA